MSIYREPEADPKCNCNFCQSSIMVRTMTYVMNVYSRRLSLAVVVGVLAALGILGFAAVKGYAARPPQPEPCIESVDVRFDKNDSYVCSPGGVITVIPKGADKYFAICTCLNHNPIQLDGGLDASDVK